MKKNYPFIVALFLFVFSSFYSKAQNVISIGTDTIYKNSVSVYNNTYLSKRVQIIVTADEIKALGIPKGTISSIAFKIKDVSGCGALNNFSIKIKETSLSVAPTQLTSSGLTTVYSVASYQPINGINQHNFTTPFYWGGDSNLLIETCYSNSTVVSGAITTVYCSYNTEIRYRHKYDVSCGTPTTASWWTLIRPNIDLSIQPPTYQTNLQPVSVSNLTPILAPDSHQVLTVKIVNLGSVPLSTIPLKISIDSGQTYISQTFTGTTLNQGDTGTFTFTATANMHIQKAYYLSLVTCLANDSNKYNDTLRTSVFTCNTFAGNYTIGNDSLDDFPTISNAVNAICRCGLNAPTVFNIKPGVYTEHILINNIPNISDTNNLVIKPFDDLPNSVFIKFKINSPIDPYNYGLVELRNTKHLTLKKITFQSTDSIFGNGILILGNSNNITLDSNTIISSSILLNTSVINIQATGGHFKVSNNKLNGGEYGITIVPISNTIASNNKILNNSISHFFKTGIFLRFMDSLECVGNTIKNGIDTSQYGISLFHCVNYYNIEKNIIQLSAIRSSDGIGDNSNNFNIPNPASCGIIRNNFISISNGSSRNIGILSQNSSGTIILNNSVYINAGDSTSSALYQLNNYANTLGIKVKNNIFSNTGLGYAYYIKHPSLVAESNYNNYFTTGNKFVYWNANKNTLASLRLSNGKDQNSISANPHFNSTTDLHLTNASPINNAFPMTQVMYDIDGDSRIMNNPDMGADEFVAGAHDMMVSALVNPNNKICGKQDESIIVLMKNNGLRTETNLTIKMEIQSPKGQFIKTGLIQQSLPGQFNLVLMDTFDMSLPGNYSFKVYAIFPSDLNRTNDTLSLSLSILPDLAFPHIEHFNTNNSNWSANMSLHTQGNYNLTSNAIAYHLNSTSPAFSESLLKGVKNIAQDAYLSFDYRLSNFSGSGTYTPANDSIKVLVSLDCGSSYTQVYTIHAGNHTPSNNFQTVHIKLNNQNPANLALKFEGVWKSGDYWVHLDNIIISSAHPFELGNDTTICDAHPLTLNAGSSTLYTLSYDWRKAGAGASIGNTSNLVVSTSGKYYVTVNTQFGIQTSDTITIISLPSPYINLGADTLICTSESITLNAGSGYSSYLWNTGETTPSILLDSTGIGTGQKYIIASVQAANGCRNSDSLMITFVPVPNAQVSGPQQINYSQQLTLDAGIGYYNYLWNTGHTTQQIILGGNSLDTTAAVHFWVRVNNGGNCIDTAHHYVQVKNDVGILEQYTDKEIQISPNPGNGRFFIAFGKYSGKTEIQIIGQSGQILEKRRINIHQNENIEFNMEHYPKGVYLLKFVSKEWIITERVVVE